MSAVPLRYNVRSLRVRWVTASLTMAGIALVVATFVGAMALAAGLSRTLGDGADPHNAVVLFKGGISEAMSRVTMEQYRLLRDLPQISDASLESLVQINLARHSGVETLVVMRGMSPAGWAVRRRARVTQGRKFTPQSGSCVIGKKVAAGFRDMKVGGQLSLGVRSLTIVGILEADGSSAESEIWADLDDVISVAHRDWYNSVIVRVKKPEDIPALAAAVARDARLDLGVKSEAAYLSDQASDVEGFRVVGLIVCFFMAVGAILAAMNTMYAAIGSRTREIGTLRALGFSKRAILASFVGEAVLLALPGGLAGCFAGRLFDGYSMSVVTFASASEVSFDLTVTPAILACAFTLSVSVGLVGGFLPALQASRLSILDALRKV